MYKRACLVLLLTLFAVLSCQLPTGGSGENSVVPEVTMEELARAGDITEEIIGEAPSSTHTRWICYIPNGSGWNIMLPYSKDYLGDGVITTFSADSKAAKTITMGYRKNEADRVQDYNYSPRLGLKRFIYPNMVVMPMQTKYQKEIIMTYNIGSNSFGQPFVVPHDSFRMLVADANREGIIRASGSYTENGQRYLLFYQYNPFTKELTFSTPYAINNREMSDYSYDMTRAVGDWILVGWGSQPWTMIGYNFKTKKWKKFREVPGRGSYATFMMYKQKDQSIIIFSQEIFGDKGSMKYWRFRPTDEGEFLPTDARPGDHNPNLDLHPLQKEYPYLGGINQRLYIHHSVVSTTPPPLIDESSLHPAPDGRVEVKYSYKGSNQTALTHVPPFQTVCKMVGTAGDYLYGAADAYGEHVFYNMKTGRSHIFDGSNISVYSMKTVGSKVYMAGYPNFILREYDTATMTMNDIGHNSYVKTHRPLAGIELGSDGKIYYAGRYYRTREGGGIAWYDPATGQKGGLPIDNYHPFWMASVWNGRFMVMSCREEGGRLAVYSVESGKLAIYSAEGLFPGHVVGIGQDIIGYGVCEQEGPVIYRMDPLTTEIVWKVKVPYKPTTSASTVRKQAFVMTYDNKGSVYIGLDRYLVRVNVDGGHVEVLGRLPSRANLTIYNGRLYQAGRAGFAKLNLP